MEIRPARLKRSCKKISKDKLTSMVLDYIIKTDKSYVCKEDLAFLFKVKIHEVEQVFQVLNLKGILSQRHAEYAHDTNRNPIFPMPGSGWASDSYSIYDKEKAEKLLKEMI